MTVTKRWTSRIAAGLVVAAIAVGAYYKLMDAVLFERLTRLYATETTVSGRVIGTKVVACVPEAGYLLGWGYLAGNKRPVAVRRTGAPAGATGVRDYPLGKADFGRWHWSDPEGLSMDAVGMTIRYGPPCNRRVTIGPMPVEPPTTGVQP